MDLSPVQVLARLSRESHTAAMNAPVDIESRDPQRPGELDRRDPHHRFLLLLLGLGLIIFWVPRLPGSLWVDETTTAWTVDTSFGEMLDRSVEFQSMPPT